MKHCISRRTFIETAALAGAALAGSWASAVAVEVKGAPAPPKTAMPVIDSHIHLYDPFRPQGVPWPGKDNPKLYQTSLPARYRPIAEPLGIVGAIEVECSGWAEDNVRGNAVSEAGKKCGKVRKDAQIRLFTRVDAENRWFHKVEAGKGPD